MTEKLDDQIKASKERLLAAFDAMPASSADAVAEMLELLADEVDGIKADALAALTSAGYRILAPGDLDPVTLERAAEHFSKVAGDAGFGVFKSSTVAAAIRALSGDGK